MGAAAHLGGPGKRAVKLLWWLFQKRTFKWHRFVYGLDVLRVTDFGLHVRTMTNSVLSLASLL